MGHVRPFTAEDIPQVAQLHFTVFRPGGRAGDPPLDAYREYFTRAFLDHPFREPGIRSLVYEEPDGRIVGFVGIVPRRMAMSGRRLVAAISSQFVVDPSSAIALVAVRLAKAYLEGAQDVSISDEASDVSRRIWEGLGGVTALLLSMHWTRPLRPARLAASLLRSRNGFSSLARAVGPLARSVDALVTHTPASQLRQVRPRTWAADLCGTTIVETWPEFTDPEGLRAMYDEREVDWLLARAGERGGRGVLKAAVRDGPTTVGWYVCHLGGDGVADLLHIAATEASVHAVLDHLFYEAWRQGAVAVTGRLEPRHVQAFSDRYCLFHRRGPWLMVHSKDPDLVQAFRTGAASLSRLDGEWSLRFSP